MDKALRTYRKWAVAVSINTEQRDLFLLIPALSMDQRKGVLSLCRCQVFPFPGSPLRSQLYNVWDTSIYTHGFPLFYYPVWFETTYSDYIASLSQHIKSGIFCGLLSLVIRIAPFRNQSFLKDFLATNLEKEISASVNIYHPVTFDYGVILSDDRSKRSDPFSKRLPPNPIVAQSLYEDFCRTIPALENTLIWPDIGLKTVGEDCSRKFWDAYVYFGMDFKENAPDSTVSCCDLERLYMHTGFQCGGHVEMRQAWKYNDLKPRTYFARGGDPYFESRYIQPCLNIIIDFFPECHRVNRFQEPPNHVLSPSEIALIYDYISFTSAFEEIRNAIHAFSIFYDGVMITIIDSFEGPLRINLGDMFRSYNATCNLFAPFDVPGGAEMATFLHTCGMLGVPGNIFSCTLMHGIHLRFVAGIGNARTVGDDGKLYMDIQDPESNEVKQTYNILQSIGQLEPSKMFRFEYSVSDELEDLQSRTYQYIKRPYFRLDTRMYSGQLIVFPNPAYLLHFSDNTHVPNPATGIEDTFKRYRRGLKRLIRSIPEECLELNEDDHLMLQSFVKAPLLMLPECYSEKPEDKKKVEGFIPRSKLKRLLYMTIPEDVEKFDPEWLECYQYELDEEILVQEPWVQNSYHGYEVGSDWYICSAPVVGWLLHMGFIEGKVVMKTVTRAINGEDSVIEYLRKDYKPLYHYTVVATLPEWVLCYL